MSIMDRVQVYNDVINHLRTCDNAGVIFIINTPQRIYDPDISWQLPVVWLALREKRKREKFNKS